MAAVNLSAVMDGIGARIAAWGGVRNVYSWPVSTVVEPCALVDFPPRVSLAETMSRGGDHLEVPVLVLVGRAFDKESRDALSAVIAGGSDIVNAVEGSYAWGDADVTSAEVTTASVGGIEYLALKLTVDVLT